MAPRAPHAIAIIQPSRHRRVSHGKLQPPSMRLQPLSSTRQSCRRFLAVALLLQLVACGGGGDGPLSPAELAGTLRFSAAAHPVLVGQSAALGGMLVDTRGTPVDLGLVQWTSSAPTVATVGGDGSVVGLSPGVADVVAADGIRSATIRVVVSPVPVASISFRETPTDLFVGDELLLRAVPRDSAGNELITRVVSYTSSDTAVATVTASGVLTAVGHGTVAVTGESGGQSAKLLLHVTSRTVASVEVVPTALWLQVGSTERLGVVLRDGQGQQVGTRPLLFNTTDGAVAVVDGQGVVRAVGPGRAEIVVEAEGRSGRAVVSVWEVEQPPPPPPPAGNPPAPVPAPPAADAGDASFAITVRFVGEPDARAAALMDQAAARWTAAITRGLADIPVEIPAEACFEGQPAISETVDDVLIMVRVLEIDGPGRGLARAGPCLIRTADGLPLLGLIDLDRADLGMDPRTVLDVVTHEMGHVLGIGTLWWYRSLVHGSGGENPLFQGEAAMAAYGEMGGAGGFVPVENTGGPGTRDVHWREGSFRAELMTGFINPGVNALSRVTIASLRDLGYRVNPGAAESYALPVPGSLTGRVVGASGTPVHDEVLSPRFEVDADGRMRRLP